MENGQKPVEEMTREEVAAELAAARARRETAPSLYTGPESVDAAEDIVSTEQEDADTVEEWPHAVIEHHGLKLQVRKPDESALIALAMSGTPGIDPNVQMRIFTRFLMHHMSESSFVEVIEAMTDPVSEIDMQTIVAALTQI
jgi:hypothetical protein